ncbi:hypothetical protein MUK42_30998, partial [Musa troglodytarum]
VFCASSRKFKILTIPNLLGLGKLSNHGFAKKRYGHKGCVKSMFDQFFMYQLENLKY